jgi:NADH-quinone oxidoreductase subunit G
MSVARIDIDGTAYEVEAGQNLLHACLSLGFDVPYFCWHPALGSVGACRQCAVKQFHDPKDAHGRIVMSCMTPAADGTRISIVDPEARAFRASVIEWLMTNHPHDCPVCEEGGECHLQDMTLMTGHVYRRYRFKKRTFRNQYLGPFVTHEMNRCIACYRCVRFYRDYAGGRDFDVFAIHRNVYFGRHEDGVLENEFSGNLAEVCPTGVFDDKTFSEHFNRKWDMRSAPSLCVHCGLGCNTTANERFGKLRRILNRYNSAVNGYFLCDRGRFGYGFVNGDRRIRSPLRRGEPVRRAEALRHVADALRGGSVIGIGSPRASLEANFALRALVGPERFHLGLSDADHHLLALVLQILRDGAASAASLHDAEHADAVLVLGEDVPNTAPRLALSLRQAVRQRSLSIADTLKIPRWQDEGVREAAGAERSPLFIATPADTRLDDVAASTFRATPDEIARLGFAVAHAIDAAASPVPGLGPEIGALADKIAERLRAAERPLVVAGTSCGNSATLEAAANVAWALRRAGRAGRLCLTVPECNSLGLALMKGGRLSDAFAAVESGEIETLVILENDLYRRADRMAVERCFDKVRHLVVLDHLLTETAHVAEIVLPVASFAESDGTLVSSEGRAQRFFQVVVPEGEVEESWRWLREITQALGRLPEGGSQRMDDLTAACADALSDLARIREAAPDANYRMRGSKIRREPHRYSGRTAIDADKSIREPPPPEDPDTPFSFSMEGYYGPLPPAVIPYFWAPSWNSVQSLNKFQQEIGGPLRGGDPGVRLIEPAPAASPAYFCHIPPAFARRENEWLIVPLYEIFGSEELSQVAPAVAERVSASYLALCPDDAAGLGLEDGAAAEVKLGEAAHRLSLRLRKSLPAGIAGLGVGLAGAAFLRLPAWAKIAAAPP